MTTRRRHNSPDFNSKQYSYPYNQSGQQRQEGQSNGWTVTTLSETAANSSVQGSISTAAAEMTCRDRTHEFFATIKSMQSRQVSSNRLYFKVAHGPIG